MRRRVAGAVLLIAVLFAGVFGASESGLLRSVDADESNGCGIEDYRVTNESVGAAAATPVATPDGLFRPVEQQFGTLQTFEIAGATPVAPIATYKTTLGTFCLEAGGTVFEGDYSGQVNMITVTDATENGRLVITITAFADGVGSAEVCDDQFCSNLEAKAAGDTIELTQGQSIRTVNALFDLHNPGDQPVVFTVANLTPGDGGCPARCWVSP